MAKKQKKQKKDRPVFDPAGDLERFTAELKEAEEERSALKARWREKYLPEVEELIDFARQRNHSWVAAWSPASEAEEDDRGLNLKELLLVVLCATAEEQRRIGRLDNDIKDLKGKVREAKKLAPLYAPRVRRGE